jgi:hypothetical protein
MNDTKHTTPPAGPKINETCPCCGQAQDITQMSHEQVCRLSWMNGISGITLRIFEFVNEVGEKKVPMMTKIGAVERGTGRNIFEVDLWAGIGETPITRLYAKNEEIETLKAARAESAAEQKRWVACSERLPSQKGFYWVTTLTGLVTKSAFYVGAFDKNAVAWMNITKPPPYTGETK